jgi:hypothetical protein
MYTGVYVKYSLFCQILINLEIFRRVLKYYKSDLLKIQWKWKCSMLMNGQIDITKPTFAFPSFANTPKMVHNKKH